MFMVKRTLINYDHFQPSSVGPGSAIEIDDRKESHFRIEINGCHRTSPMMAAHSLELKHLQPH